MPLPVIDTVHGYLDYEINNGGYEAHDAFADEVSGVYESIASMVNADPSEIAIADSATRAWDMAFYGLRLGEGDRLLTTSTEYVSNWAAYLHLRDTKGVVVDVVPDTPTGEIDLEALERAIDGSVKLVTLNHVPTNSGLVNPAVEIGSIARRNGVPFLLDACQSVGQLPVDVEAIGCDMLSGTSRKYLRGPRGEGFLFVRDDFIQHVDPTFVELETATIVLPDRYELRSDARRFETWEKNYANVVGMGAAAKYAMSIGIDAIWVRIQELATRMRTGLSEVDGVMVRDIGAVQGGIVTFEVDGRLTQEVKELLSERSINVSISTPSSSPLDMHQRDIRGLIRASVHAYNSEDEVDALVEAITVMA